MNLGMRRAALVALAVARACDYELTFDGARVSISVESIGDVPRAAEAMVNELIHTLKTGQYGCGFASCFDELVRTDMARACFSQPAPVYVPPPAPTRAPLEPVLEPQVAQPKISAHTVTQTTALTKQTSAPLADPKVNAPSIVTRVQMFDNSEYKRRMREGSGFFYDMQGVDAPKPF